MGNDIVNHPSHYTSGGYETWDFIEDAGLDFLEANAVKYISRAGLKTEDQAIDLKKAIAYLKKKEASSISPDKVKEYIAVKKLSNAKAQALIFILARMPSAAIRVLEAEAKAQAAREGADSR